MHLTKDGIDRVLKTFIQAALAYIAVNFALVDFTSDNETLKSAVIGILVASAAAGLSAAMNLEKKEESHE